MMQTTVVHCKKAPYDIYIGRPSKWENPFTHLPLNMTRAKYHVASREDAIEAYREYLFVSGLAVQVEELRGKVLGCWCKPLMCHGDILAELADQ